MITTDLIVAGLSVGVDRETVRQSVLNMMNVGRGVAVIGVLPMWEVAVSRKIRGNKLIKIRSDQPLVCNDSRDLETAPQGNVDINIVGLTNSFGQALFYIAVKWLENTKALPPGSYS